MFTMSTSCQLLAALSDQTIINSIVTIGLEDSLNPANPVIYSAEPFSLTVYGTFGEVTEEEREERTGESRRVEESRGEGRSVEERWMSIPDSIY